MAAAQSSLNTPAAQEDSDTPSAIEEWISHPDARTLNDFREILHTSVRPEADTNDFFRAVFGSSQRPEYRLHVTSAELPEVYRMLRYDWVKVSSMNAVRTTREETNSAGIKVTVNLSPQEIVDKTASKRNDNLMEAIAGLATHTCKFMDARGASTQTSLVDPTSREPYIISASVTAEDGRLSPAYTNSVRAHAEAALLEAEVMLDGRPFSLAAALVQGGEALERAQSILKGVGYQTNGALQERFALGGSSNSILIVQDAQGNDLQIVPHVSINVDRALHTAKWRKNSVLYGRTREFMVGGTKKNNVGMLNTFLNHFLVVQTIPWSPLPDVQRTERLLMSARTPLAKVVLSDAEKKEHPLLKCTQSHPKSQREAKEALLALFDRLIEPILLVHDTLRTQEFSDDFWERVTGFERPGTGWHRLLTGALDRYDVTVLANDAAKVVWGLLRLPTSAEQFWTAGILEGAIHAVRPRQPFFQEQ